MSLCDRCARYYLCPMDQRDPQVCAAFTPADVLPSRGTTTGELTRMHVESESPEHYKYSSIEPIDAMRAWLGDDGFAAYCRGSVIKYMSRIGHKDEVLVEAKKAQTYARWLVETIEGKELTK